MADQWFLKLGCSVCSIAAEKSNNKIEFGYHRNTNQNVCAHTFATQSNAAVKFLRSLINNLSF